MLVPGATALRISAVTYRYRYCERCCREWPAERTQCPECLLWLGSVPLERIEWQILPGSAPPSAPDSYKNVGSAAVALRLIGFRPSCQQLRATQQLLTEFLRLPRSEIAPVETEGWLIWSSEGLRTLFLDALAFSEALVERSAEIERIMTPGTRLRWGIWVDDVVLPFGSTARGPCVNAALAASLFNFDPDNLLLSTESVFRANRSWEHFVCIPARRRDGSECNGFRRLTRKRPSAVDHAKVAEQSPFVGRETELQLLDDQFRRSRISSARVAIIAPAGTGKTRLVNAWLQRQTAATLRACFSIFGGDLESFAAQLVGLPEPPFDTDTLVAHVRNRIETEQVGILVLDDLHWADTDSWKFLDALMRALPVQGLLTLICARPTAAAGMVQLNPERLLYLPALPPADGRALANGLGAASAVIAAIERSGQWHPLFIEQLTAWASEINYAGGPWPLTLHEVILARIDHLEHVRLKSARQNATWQTGWIRNDVVAELDAIEVQVGLWLDRLETGDYADATTIGRYLGRLQKLDFELFITSAILGHARPRSTRLGESIERLMLGSAESVLADLTARIDALGGREDPNLSDEAERAANHAIDHHRWSLACQFLELAERTAAMQHQLRARNRLVQLRRIAGISGAGPARDETTEVLAELERNPSVDALRLPQVWLALGHWLQDPLYFKRAISAADAIGAAGHSMAAREVLRVWDAQHNGVAQL